MNNTNNIDDINIGGWFMFYLNTGKKCIGKVNVILLIDKEENIIKEEIINYLDEDGLPGAIKKEFISKEFTVLPIDMESFFENKKLNYKPRKSLKNILTKQENLN